MAAGVLLKMRRIRADRVIRLLKKAYPEARCSLDFSNPLELLVATMLSAQCTDVRVNIVTKDLFKRFRNVKAFAAAGQENLEEAIKSTGFFRNKAKSIIAMSQTLLAEHGGEVPRTMEALHGLPGVGRKTANVVLGNAFGINEGITVDTHVTRLANRLKLTSEPLDAVKIEQSLIPLVPKEEWTDFSHLLIAHGRAVCVARKPRCSQCVLLKDCPTGPKLLARGDAA